MKLIQGHCGFVIDPHLNKDFIILFSGHDIKADIALTCFQFSTFSFYSETIEFSFFSWQLEITPAGFSIYKQSRADSDQLANYEELQSNMAAAMGGFRYLVIFTVTYAHIFTFI